MTHHGEGQVQQFFQGLAVLLVTLLCPWQPARAQGTDPNTALANELIVVLTASVVVPNPRGRGLETAEVKTIKAILSWMRTGAVPADVSG